MYIRSFYRGAMRLKSSLRLHLFTYFGYESSKISCKTEHSLLADAISNQISCSGSFVLFLRYEESKKGGKDQETIQSSNTPDP